MTSPPADLDVRQTLDGIKVTLRPPEPLSNPVLLQWVAGLVCSLGGLVCAGELARQLHVPGGWFALCLVVGAVIGLAAGMTPVSWLLHWLSQQSHIEHTRWISIRPQKLTIEAPGQPPRDIPLSTIHRITLEGDTLLVFFGAQEVIQLGEEQPVAVLRWLHDALQERRAAWQAIASTDQEVPVALRALQERT